jgi:segregation and condensation protein B
MDNKKIKDLIEVLLFVAGKPLSIEKLKSLTKIDKESLLKEAISCLQEEYRTLNKGIQIINIAGGYYMCTKPEYASYINKLLKKKNRPKLSKKAMELLAIIAYKQPVSKKEIERIRKADSNHLIKNLMEYKLIQQVGKKKEGLREYPIYATTTHFLELFGLKDLNSLPQLTQVQPASRIG